MHERFCRNYFPTLFAASNITSKTSSGLESIATWLDFRTVVFALALLAILLSRSGLMALSSDETTNHDGLVFQAALLATSANTFWKAGSWTAYTTSCSFGVKSLAKALPTPSLESVKYPFAF